METVAYLLKRDAGNLLVYSSSKIEKISDPKKPELTRILRLLVHHEVARFKHVEHVVVWLFDLMKSLNVQARR